MSADLINVLAAARRQNFSLFLMKTFETLHPGEPPLGQAWYLDAICHALGEVRAGRERRLVITVPPRHLKSVTAAVAFAAYLLGHDPQMKIMVASYSADLARQHSNLTRLVMESAWYKRDFPHTRISDRGNRALELETTSGGVRKAVSVGGSITGFGADLIIVDDCMKADDARSPAVREGLREWFDGTLLSRLNDKRTGRIISIQQRLHEDDLPAYLLEKGYAHLNLPAIAIKDERVAIGPRRTHHRVVGSLLNPAREDHAVIEALRRDLGPAVFSAQYQQDPVAPEGNLIRMEWFGTYEVAPERDRFIKVIQSWDTGATANPNSDPSVCLTWGFHFNTFKWYLLDVYRERLDYPDIFKAVIRMRKQYRADRVIIENASSGHALWPDIKAKQNWRPIMYTPAACKEERFNGCLGEVEGGYFLLPVAAPWLDAFKAELKAFPHGRHDDQVDAFSQFVNYQRAAWLWVATEFTADGRAKNVGRWRTRPW